VRWGRTERGGFYRGVGAGVGRDGWAGQWLDCWDSLRLLACLLGLVAPPRGILAVHMLVVATVFLCAAALPDLDLPPGFGGFVRSGAERVLLLDVSVTSQQNSIRRFLPCHAHLMVARPPSPAAFRVFFYSLLTLPRPRDGDRIR
jgi:hypothetical protein